MAYPAIFSSARVIFKPEEIFAISEEISRNYAPLILAKPVGLSRRIALSTNELFEITIISAIGKTVKSVQSRQTLIDVDMSAFPKGMYIVRLTNKTSNSSRVSKVVVK